MPAPLARFRQRLIVARGQQQQIALLVPIEKPIGGARRLRGR